MKKIIRPKVGAKKFGVSIATFWRITKEEDFPPKIQISKRAVGWMEDEIDDFLEKRTVAKNGVVNNQAVNGMETKS